MEMEIRKTEDGYIFSDRYASIDYEVREMFGNYSIMYYDTTVYTCEGWDALLEYMEQLETVAYNLCNITGDLLDSEGASASDWTPLNLYDSIDTIIVQTLESAELLKRTLDMMDDMDLLTNWFCVPTMPYSRDRYKGQAVKFTRQVTRFYADEHECSDLIMGIYNRIH